MRGGRHRGTARGASSRPRRRGPGRGPGGPHSPGARGVAVSWRGYRKVWAKLRVEGIRTSKERVRRLMREHHLQAHGPKAHDGTITTETPDVMWGTDMTTTVTGGEGTAGVFVAVDQLHEPSASVCMRPSAEPASRPWSPSARVSANASAVSATVPPAGCGCVTTTGRTTWPTISSRRSPSSASTAPRVSCGSPKGTASRSVSSAR